MGKSGPSGREEPGATGEEETLSRPARGKPRATRQWVISRPLATGEPGATRRGGNPELCGEKKALSHSAKGKLEPPGPGGNPGSCGEKKALSRRRGNYLEPPGFGET